MDKTLPSQLEYNKTKQTVNLSMFTHKSGFQKMEMEDRSILE